jgi:hypothetical protein
LIHSLSFSDAETVAQMVAVIASAAHFLSAAQLLVNPGLFGPNAALDWNSVRARGLMARTPAGRIRSFGPRTVSALCLFKMLGALGLASAGLTGTPLLPWTALVAATSLSLVVRAPELVSAADHIANIIVVALVLGGLGSLDAMTMALGFIALHVCIAYLTAGVAKLRHPLWRNGKYVVGMVSTREFGNQWIARTLLRNPAGALISAWLVMTLEILFPALLFLPTDLAIAGVIAMTCFHAAVAAMMGFNLFFFAFPATYPAVLFLNFQVRQWMV